MILPGDEPPGCPREEPWTIRRSTAHDGSRTVELWCAAVDATHYFLTPQDRMEIGEFVRDFLPRAALWLAVDAKDQPVGFMLLNQAHIDALFVHPDYHGCGAGRALIAHALALHPALTADVNEQNERAVGFYERMGFERTGRSGTDNEGRPYPLLHMQRRPSSRGIRMAGD